MNTAPRHIDVLDSGKPIRISIEDIFKYHGFLLPGGVMHAFKVMQRVFPLLAPEGQLERRELSVETCFRWLGAQDAFEMVTRAFTEDRYKIDNALLRPERGPTNTYYVFKLTYRGKTVTAVVREGIVRDEFISLGLGGEWSAEDERQMVEMRQEMADRMLALPAEEVYDVEMG